MTGKMKAIGMFEYRPTEDPDSLVDVELPKPKAEGRDILVEVRAVSVNPVDTKVRGRKEPARDVPHVFGYDAAGVVVEVGPEVTFFKPGDEVFYAGDITRPGTNQEYHLVDERIVALKPKTLDFADAASLPLTAITAWELLFDRLGVPYGRKTEQGSLLIINGAGGVGSILTQIARRLTGLTVIATASREESVAWVRRMGAHHVINHHEPLDAQLKAIGIPEVDYVASLTASDKNLPVFPTIIAPQGRLALIDDPESFDIKPLKTKAISVHWELMFTRPMFGTADMIEQHRLLSEVAALVDDGVLVATKTQELTPIDAEQLRAAHAIQESARAIGKTVLVGFPPSA